MSRSEVVDSQRKRLLDAMAHVCARKTYPATTVADVVDFAGVSRATFYQLFTDKEDCFLATVDEALGLLVEELEPLITAPVVDWGETVRQVITAMLELMAELPEYATAVMVESLAAGEDAFDRYSQGIGLIVALLDEGRTHGTNPVTPPPRTARAMMGGGEWLIRGEMMAGRANRLPALIPDFVYIVLSPFLGQDEALRHARLAAGA